MVSLFGRRMGAVAACTGGIAYLAHDTDSALARTLRLAYNATMVSCDYKFGPASKLLSGTDEHKAAMAETHQRSAERMLKVCLLHGGLYVKLGQFVASMNFVLPPAYPTVMAACQDRANAIGFASIRTAVESELRATASRRVRVQAVLYGFLGPRKPGNTGSGPRRTCGTGRTHQHTQLQNGDRRRM